MRIRTKLEPLTTLAIPHPLCDFGMDAPAILLIKVRLLYAVGALVPL